MVHFLSIDVPGSNWKSEEQGLMQGLSILPSPGGPVLAWNSLQRSRWNAGSWTKVEPISLTATLMPESLRKKKGRMGAIWCPEGDTGILWAAHL